MTINYPRNKTIVEITESTQFIFSNQRLEIINLLRASNILVTLDDFCTGYSNLNNLESLPVDILKIKQAFVANIENDSYQQYLLQVITELAHTVGMKIIVEEVENEEQMKILRKCDAGFFQSYLFLKPLSPKQLDNFS